MTQDVVVCCLYDPEENIMTLPCTQKCSLNHGVSSSNVDTISTKVVSSYAILNLWACNWKNLCLLSWIEQSHLRKFYIAQFLPRTRVCVIWRLCVPYSHGYHISSCSFRGNYSFLNLEIQRSQYIRPKVTVHKGAENYSREESIQGRRLYEEMWYPFWNADGRDIEIFLRCQKLHFL